MMQSTIILTAASLAAITTIYLVYQRTQKYSRREYHEAFFNAVKTCLQNNLNSLEAGDLQWRRLGHGQTAIGLRRVVPRKGEVIPVSMDRMEEEYPEIIGEINSVNSDLDRVQAAADRLANVLERPVRERFQEDRRRLLDENLPEVRTFRKWLKDREDAWMEILAQLINDENTLDERSDPGALYWQHTKKGYADILEQHGSTEYADLKKLKTELTENTRSLLAKLEERAK